MHKKARKKRDYERFLGKTGEYENYLRTEERSQNICEKYARDLHAFAFHLQKSTVSKEAVLAWKEALTQAEYGRLVRAAEQRKNQRFSLLQTICATGIRVSELRFITVESAKAGRAAVDCNGDTGDGQSCKSNTQRN